MFGKGYGHSFEQTWIPFTIGFLICARFGRNWSSGYGDEVIDLFLKICVALYLNKLESPSSRDALFYFVENGPVVLEKKISICQNGLNLVHLFWRRGLLNVINEFCYDLWSPFEIGCSFPFEHIWAIFTKGFSVSIWLKLAHCFWSRRFLKWRQCIFTIIPFGNTFGVTLHLNKFEFSSHWNAFCQVWVGSVVLEKKIFKCRQCILPMISLWYQPWPFIWTNLNPLYPRNAFCLVCLKVFLGKEDFKILSLFFQYYLPWKKAWPFIWTKHSKFPRNWPCGSGED